MDVTPLVLSSPEDTIRKDSVGSDMMKKATILLDF